MIRGEPGDMLSEMMPSHHGAIKTGVEKLPKSEEYRHLRRCNAATGEKQGQGL